MNAEKIRDAIKMISEALTESSNVTEAEWAEFGRAVEAALREKYSIDLVVREEKCNPNWHESARRAWRAARPLGLHGLRW